MPFFCFTALSIVHKCNCPRLHLQHWLKLFFFLFFSLHWPKINNNVSSTWKEKKNIIILPFIWCAYKRRWLLLLCLADFFFLIRFWLPNGFEGNRTAINFLFVSRKKWNGQPIYSGASIYSLETDEGTI